MKTLASAVGQDVIAIRRQGVVDDLHPGQQVTAECPNCGNGTALLLMSRGWLWPRGDQPPKERDEPPFLRVHVWVCQYCSKSAVLFLKVGNAVDEVEAWSVWPDVAPRELPTEVPAAARSLYREASLAEKSGALRGAAALYRAVVEEVCTERQAQGKNLAERIDDLANKGVDDDLVGDLHEARTTGNWSLHEGVEFSAEEVADIANMIDQAAYQIYVEPGRREAMRDARKARRDARQPGPREG